VGKRAAHGTHAASGLEVAGTRTPRANRRHAATHGRIALDCRTQRGMTSATFDSVYTCLTGHNSTFSNRTPKTLNTKVVEHLKEIIFCKANLCIDQPFELELVAKMMSFSTLVNSTRLQLTKFFSIFHSKFEMPPKSKVVSLEKLDNVYIRRI
jgi:hypothetical protein